MNLLYYILAFSWCFCLIATEREVTDLLQNMPEEDKESLSSLFHYLVSEHFAYTLFGDKTASLAGYHTSLPGEDVLKGYETSGSFWKKWELWEKYQKKLNIKRFLIFSEDSNKASDIRFIFLINKEAFLNEVDKNQMVFNQALGRKIYADHLLSEISEKKDSFQNALHNKEILFGILLGYGKHNARLFAKRESIESKRTSGIYHLDKIQEYDQKIDRLTKKLKPFGKGYYYPLSMHSVHCVADPNHPETKALKIKYEDLHTKIADIYSKGDFLEITLRQLISE